MEGSTQGIHGARVVGCDMRTILILLALLTMIPVSEGSARRAPMRGSEAYLLNNGSVSTTGSLIVGLRPGQRRRRSAQRQNLSSFPALSLTRGETRIPLRLVQLSSTLARYVPQRRPSPGRYDVTGLVESVRFVTRSVARRLAAPTVRAVQRRTTAPRSDAQTRRPRRRPQLRQTTYSVRVVFDQALPTSAIAIVLEDARGGFAGGPTTGVSDSWEHTTGGSYRPMPSGTRPPPVVGSEVIIRLVDRDGQLGAPVTVTMSEG
jgi:hypothetical protein